MGAQPRVILRCEQCGHEWTARNTIGKSRQCSKCRSKQIIEVAEDDEHMSSGVEVVSVSQSPPVNSSITSARSNALKDDPDVRQKLKELEIARLDREINALRQTAQDASALNRMAANFWEMLEVLRDSSKLTDTMYESLRTQCVWCGAEGEHGLEFFEGEVSDGIKAGYRCRSCHHVVKLE